VETVINYLEYWLEEETDSATEYTLTNLNAQMTEAEGETTSLSLILAGVASIALLVGGIGIMNIMLVTVTERTREIGIKKAVGAKRSVIISQFLVEASVLSGIGGLLGIAVGYGGSLIIGKAMYDLILLPNFSYTIAAFLFSIIIGVGFGLYPAVKASGLQPVDALRAD
jgi:putative ABC transport system permease protein